MTPVKNEKSPVKNEKSPVKNEKSSAKNEKSESKKYKTTVEDLFSLFGNCIPFIRNLIIESGNEISFLKIKFCSKKEKRLLNILIKNKVRKIIENISVMFISKLRSVKPVFPFLDAVC